MESISLVELRKKLAFLPVLQDRLEALRVKINAAEGEVNSLLKKYEEESLDVEKLQRDTLSTILLKNFGRYEDKVTKESEEMLAAKLEYDKANVRLGDLKKTRDESEARLSELLRDKAAFEEELKRRTASIRSDTGSDIFRRYNEIEKEQDALAKQLSETEEAYAAARRALGTAASAKQHLESAESWATFDVWSRGGIISHMAKYGNIDSASEDFNRLNDQLEDLQKELRDIDMTGIASLDGIDGTTRAVDFWFDNIFTDMHVRDRIRDDSSRVSEVYDKISGIAYKLDGNMSDIQKRIKDLESMKKDLVVNNETV